LRRNPRCIASVSFVQPAATVVLTRATELWLGQAGRVGDGILMTRRELFFMTLLLAALIGLLILLGWTLAPLGFIED
jgi:hypothetical protein